MKLKGTVALILVTTMVLSTTAFAWEVKPYEDLENVEENIGKTEYDSVLNSNSDKGYLWNEQQREKGLKEDYDKQKENDNQLKQAVENKMNQTNVDEETKYKVEELMDILSQPEHREYLEQLADEKDSTLKEILRLENEGKIEEAVALATEQVDEIYKIVKEMEEEVVTDAEKALEEDEKIKSEEAKVLREQVQEEFKLKNKELKEMRKNGFKEEVKKIQDDLKELRKGEYTQEELDKVIVEAEALKTQYKDLRTLPVENINVVGKNVKFDTPPVIKGGRTLVPVRAITEGLGAEVQWNAKTQEVTITKDGTVIVLTLGSNEVKVNGEIIQIDTEANMYSNRTYVPIRFISETFKANVNWDAENEVVEIEPVEEEPVIEEPVIEEPVIE